MYDYTRVYDKDWKSLSNKLEENVVLFLRRLIKCQNSYAENVRIENCKDWFGMESSRERMR